MSLFTENCKNKKHYVYFLIDGFFFEDIPLSLKFCVKKRFCQIIVF